MVLCLLLIRQSDYGNCSAYRHSPIAGNNVAAQKCLIQETQFYIFELNRVKRKKNKMLMDYFPLKS